MDDLHDLYPYKGTIGKYIHQGLQKSSFEDFICKLNMINVYDPT